jgi:small subunit ribosomal protein S9
MMTKKTFSGKRKRAVAKATISPGNGKITINKKPYSQFAMLEKLRLEEPVRIAAETLGEIKFDIKVSVNGGGKAGQIEAARLAIGRALLEAVRQEDSEKAEKLKRAYLNYDRNLLVADTRRKETYKPGDSKARAKRQKSYR